jgi:hypothetical protein
MACIPAFLKTRLEAMKAAKEAQLTAAYASVLAAMDNVEVSEYEFDSGEGRQRAKRRAPKQLQDLIDRLEKELISIERQLAGYGIASIKPRR